MFFFLKKHWNNILLNNNFINLTYVCWIFEFIFKFSNWKIEYSARFNIFFVNFFSLSKTKEFENFNISKNNVISVEAAKYHGT